MNFWSEMADTGGNLNTAPREILPGVRVYPNPSEVARGGARLFVDYAWQSISKRGEFMVALSGGNTPRMLFEYLASEEFRGQVDWAKVHVFWSDERAVPPDNPESNYGMARRELLIRVPIPLANVHRMEAEKPNIGRAAHEYEEVLRKYLELDERGFPRFDLIFLGMGTDGHTASLFPGTAALEEIIRRVVANFVPKLNTWRLTFTLPLINHARHVCFLVNAAKHADLIERVLKGDLKYPASRVNPDVGKLTWILGEN